jgi:small basic protein (TIGR04137 family)
MSLHPSLKIDKAGSAQRTVLTRIERIKEMMKKGVWSDASSVTALPKTKIVRIKAKKKTATDATAAAPGAEGAAAPAAAGKTAAAGKPAAAAKPAAPAKK